MQESILNKKKLLIVDDEEAVRRFLRVVLSSQGYTVIDQASGRGGISSIATEKPDVVILDLGLPDIDGVQVTRLVREWSLVPIIVLSVRDSEADKIAALDSGADDYLTKPFGAGELLARLRAALRHKVNVADGPIFTTGSFKVDLARRLVSVSGREVQLTPTEYGVLRVLVNNAGKVLTHGHLLREVWGPEFGEEFHILHVNISNLRHKIELNPTRPQYIITEPGVGYRLRIE